MMQKIGLFYASSTGNTEQIAKTLKEKMLTTEVDLYDVSDCDAEEMKRYDHLILGVSTWGEGDLQDDWEEYLPELDKVDFTDKTVALFGLGDQEEYCDNFLDGMGTSYDKVIKGGATVIGSWPTDDHDYDESTAIRDDEFVGLALDEDDQDDLSDKRLSTWIELISPYLLKEVT